MSPFAIFAAGTCTGALIGLLLTARRALSGFSRPAAPTHPEPTLTTFSAPLEPNAWRCIVITQQPGRVDVQADGSDDVVPLLAEVLRRAIEQRDRDAEAVRERMARAGQGEWAPRDEVVF